MLRRLSQIPGTTNPGIDRENPLTRGLVGLAVPHLQRELVTGNLGVATASFAPATTNPGGLGGRTSEAVNTRLAFAGGWSKINAPLTLVVVYRLRGTPTASNRIAGNWAANSYGYEITPSTTNFRAFITRAGAGIALTGNAVNTQLQVDVLTIDATNGAYYQKGALVAGPSAHGGMVTPTGSFTFGSSNDGDSSHSAEYYFAALYRRILSDAEIVKISANPWQLFRQIAVPVKTTASGAYTLTADNAAWQFAAQDAALKVARKLSAANAPWEFAAQSAGLTVARKITADNAAWEFAAQDATLTYTPAGAYVLTAESTGWQFAVPDATLTYTPIQGDRASGGFAWLEYISDREREEYRKKRREVYQNAPKKVTAVVKKVAQKAAIEQREPEPEEIEQAFQSEGVAYQPDYGQMAQNAYRLYLQLLINRRKLEQEAEKEREQTRQFIAEQTRIALEDQQRRAQLIEEEAVFMTVAALLLD